MSNDVNMLMMLLLTLIVILLTHHNVNKHLIRTYNGLNTSQIVLKRAPVDLLLLPT